jgi:hypothetical protein
MKVYLLLLFSVLLEVVMVGLTLVGGEILYFSSLNSYESIMGKAFVSYETNRRKTQEKSQILANQLPAGKWTGSLVHWPICSHDAGLCLVDYFDILILANSNFIINAAERSCRVQ